MDLYSIDKLMAETRQLAAKYRQATGSTLAVTGEIARFDVAKTLELTLIDDLTLGHDAIGTGERDGLRILIKGRVIFEDSKSSPRIGQIKADGRWDHVVLVLFDDDYLPVEMYEATEAEIKKTTGTESGAANKKRGAMSVAQFKKIGQLVWNNNAN